MAGLREMQTRPHITFRELIFQAIESTEDHKATTQEIYAYIIGKYPYYRSKNEPHNWQNTVRHNLSVQQCFFRVMPRENENRCCWEVKGSFKIKCQNGTYLLRNSLFNNLLHNGNAPAVVSSDTAAQWLPLYDFQYEEETSGIVRNVSQLFREESCAVKEGDYPPPAGPSAADHVQEAAAAHFMYMQQNSPFADQPLGQANNVYETA
ncbi:hypothetical protein FKM82_018208 [Ascaphus truei]